MIWWSILSAAIIAVVWVLLFFWELIAVGAAYKAKTLSTLIFACRRNLDATAIEVSADSYLILRIFGVHIDTHDHLVTAAFLGLRPQTARWAPESGSTLIHSGRTHARASSTGSVRRAASASPWPEHRGSSLLADVARRAFSEPNPKRLRRTQAVVIAHKGAIVAEQYAPPFGPDSLFAGWSMAKSLAPALIGILVGDGALSLTDTELLPAWRHRDARAAITLEDLLRMRSGLRFTEVYSTPRSDVMRMLYRQPDMSAYAASLPLVAPPATRWSYASGTSNILSAIVRRSVGEVAYADWPRRMIFDRIGMASALLEADASGTFVLSSYMFATARDWARFGQWHLQEGAWDGVQLLPEGWLDFCRTPTPQSPTANYGAHWWLKLQPDVGGDSLAAARIPSDAFFAVGHEGQTLTVIPSLELVIVRHGLSIYIDAWNQAEFVAEVIDAVQAA